MYVDGVYYGRTVGGILDLLDLQRVEVLRGPQGTLFGRNTIGGAISAVTSKPGENFHFTAQVTGGSDGRLDFQGLLSGPVTQNLFAKIAAGHKGQDGYVHNLVNGEVYGDRNSETYRGMLRWVPADNLEIVLSGDYHKDDQSASPTVSVGTRQNPGPLLTVGLVVQLLDPTFGDPAVSQVGPHATRGLGPDFYEGEFWGANGSVSWDISDRLSSRLIIAHREISTEGTFDVDKQPYSFTDLGETIDQDQTSVELQLLGTASDDRLQWVAGVFYMDEDSRLVNDVTFGGETLYNALEAALPPFSIPWLAFQLPFGCAALPPFLPPCAGGAGNPLNFAPAIHLNLDVAINSKSTAGFGQATYALTDNMSFTGGLRYSRDEKDSVLNSLSVIPNILTVTPTQKTWEYIDYRAGLEYKPSDDALYYLVTSTGHKSGGINPRPLTPEGFAPFDQAKLTAYEIGAKTDWHDRQLRLNGAVFLYDYKDIQVLTNVATASGIDIIMRNAGSATVWGLEFEATAVPTDALVLTAALGYTDFAYDSVDPAAGIGKDNAHAYTPKWTFAGSAQYTFFDAILDGDLILHANFHWQDDTFLDELNHPTLFQESYETVNARVTWRSADKLWDISAYGKDLTDNIVKLGGTDVLDGFGHAEAAFTRGREWGISVRYTFQ